MKSIQHKVTAMGLAMTLLSFSIPPMAGAQGAPQMQLQATGTVQVWNARTNTWDPFVSGVAQEGQTFRAIEGGSLDCNVVNEGASVENLHLSSCSAIRFLKMNLRQGGNTIYAKAFGQIGTTLSQDRTSTDDVKVEYPVGLEVIGRDAGTTGVGPVQKTTYQTPTAREVRLAVTQNSAARLQGLSYISGTVESVNASGGTFTLKEDMSGRVDTVSLKYWSQIAKPTLAARIMNETPAQMVEELQVGQKLTVYGVATAARTGSLPLGGGFGAFAQATPINFVASVLFPGNGLYIFGGTFVLSSPITPEVGQGVGTAGINTLRLAAGELQASLLPGAQLLNVACEIGNEVFTVAPPLPVTAVATGGGIGALPIYILLGAGAAVLINNHGNNNNILNASP